MSENVELLVGLLTGGVEAAERLTEKEARELVAAVQGEVPSRESARIAQLEKDSDFLARLHGAGVNNWEGYSNALDDEEEEA